MVTRLLDLALIARWIVFPLAAYAFVRAAAGAPVSALVRRGLLLGAILVAFAALGVTVHTVRTVPEWDFPGSYIFGHAVTRHVNVYDPASFRDVVSPVAADGDLRKEVMDTAFLYPPASVLIYAPLGLIDDVHLASACWMTGLAAALALAIVLLARTYGGSSAVAVAALTLAFPATIGTLELQQTGIAVLLTLAVFTSVSPVTEKREIVRGLAAAVAVVFKPFMIVLPLYLVLRGRRTSVATATVALGIATLASLPLIGGIAALGAYLRVNPASRLPAYVYTESGTASLYAEVLRVSGRAGSFSGPLHDPAFLLIAVPIAAVALWLTIASKNANADLLPGLAIATGLILYPSASAVYAIVLIPTFLATLKRLGAASASAAAVAATLVYAGNDAGGAGTFSVVVAFWLLTVVTIAAAPGRRGLPASARADVRPRA